jgi:hypothetical protein
MTMILVKAGQRHRDSSNAPRPDGLISRAKSLAGSNHWKGPLTLDTDFPIRTRT